jgi:beta-fructofuranosidase
MTNTVTKLDDGWKFAGDEYELVQFDAFENAGRIEADISGYEDDDKFGIGFAPDFSNVSTLNYVFNVPENRIEFYNTERLMDDDPQSYIDFDFSGRDSIHINIFADAGVVTMYVDDEVALTARMYTSQGSNWQLFGINSTAGFDHFNLYQ